jgi:hypothetical protein
MEWWSNGAEARSAAFARGYGMPKRTEGASAEQGSREAGKVRIQKSEVRTWEVRGKKIERRMTKLRIARRGG